MAIQPIPNREIGAFRTRIRVSHQNQYCDIETQTFDEAHIHSCYEIYVNLSGDISFLHEDCLYAIQRGDVVFSRPGDVHCCVYRSSCVHEHVCLWFESDEGSLSDFINRLGIASFVRLSESRRSRVLDLLHWLSDTEIDSALGLAYFIELLAELGVKGEDGTLPEDAEQEKVKKILAYVEENYLQRLTTRQIAKACFLSESTLNRLLRLHVGLSASRLIEAKRLSYAEKLLRADATVTEACFRSGFSDCSRFITQFKRKFGITPLQYKKRIFGQAVALTLDKTV